MVLLFFVIVVDEKDKCIHKQTTNNRLLVRECYSTGCNQNIPIRGMSLWFKHQSLVSFEDTFSAVTQILLIRPE